MHVTKDFRSCSCPLSHDVYQGCAGNCCYCTSRERNVTMKGKAFHVITPRPDKTAEAFNHWRYAVQVSPNYDPLPPEENKFHATEQFLTEQLSRRAVILITKQNPLAYPGIVRLVAANPGRFVFNMSMSTDDERSRDIIEGTGIPSITERIEALRELRRLGAVVTVRMWPFVPEWFTNLPVFIDRIADAGANAVLVGDLQMPSVSGDHAGRLIQVCQSFRLPYVTAVNRPVRQFIAWYAKVAGYAHQRGMAAYTSRHILRRLSDSSHCCGHDLLDLPQEYLHMDNVGHWGWEDDVVRYRESEEVMQEPAALMTHSAAICDTRARAKIKGITLGQFTQRMLTQGQAGGWLAFAKQVEPGVWKQNQEWIDYCAAVRRPDIIENQRQALREQNSRPV